MKSTWCAICASDCGPFVRRPLGRDDAMVSVCDSCDGEPARTVDGPERCYEPAGSLRSISDAISKAKFRIVGKEKLAAGRNETMLAKTPGWLIVRVPRRDVTGISRDRRKAESTLVNQPWVNEAHYLGCDARFFLFERPDPKLARASRIPSTNPLVEIERFRVAK